MTLNAERWLDEVVLRAQVLDVAVASISEEFTSPVGIGDLAILSALVAITNIGTVPVTATMPRGVVVQNVAQDAATVVDYVGAGEFVATAGVAAAFTKAHAHIDPDALMLWRQGEILVVEAPEMDAGATGDLVFIVKCVRVRPIEAPARGPIRLVR